MLITQAKTGHNAVAAVRAHDAIGIIAVGVEMIADLAEMEENRVKAIAIKRGHEMTIAEVRVTSGAAILAKVNLNAHRRRSWI